MLWLLRCCARSFLWVSLKVSAHALVQRHILTLPRLDPYPYPDYNTSLRTRATRDVLHQMEQETIVLLENRNETLPLSSSDDLKVAIIGPQGNRVSVKLSIPFVSSC